jgi:tripartite-type tricarboxylate transporter receptor subunit TctC
MKASATSSACEEDRRTTRPLRAIAVGAIAALSAVWAFAVNAQTYPERPIRVIVPIAAGSVTDVIMRATASELAPRLGQPFVIENRGGASGIPGAQACAQAAPDGYTLCLVYHNTLSINPLLFNQLPYDPERDFTLITNLYLLIEALFVNSSLNVNTAAELKAYAQAHPSTLNYGTLGPGSNPEMFLKWMNQTWNVNIVGIPYRGGGPIAQALVAGELQVAKMGLGNFLGLLGTGKIKPLAVAAARRSVLVPEIPTLAEAGIDFPPFGWWGLAAPRGVPQPIVDRLNTEFVTLYREAKFVEYLEKQAVLPAPGTPAEFLQFLKRDRQDAEFLIRISNQSREDYKPQ